MAPVLTVSLHFLVSVEVFEGVDQQLSSFLRRKGPSPARVFHGFLTALTQFLLLGLLMPMLITCREVSFSTTTGDEPSVLVHRLDRPAKDLPNEAHAGRHKLMTSWQSRMHRHSWKSLQSSSARYYSTYYATSAFSTTLRSTFTKANAKNRNTQKRTISKLHHLKL